MASQWTLIWLLLLSLTIVAFSIDVHNMNIDEYLDYVNPPAVHKFRNEHGDNILCVLYADQISLRGSEQRSVETRNEQKAQLARNFSVKTGCPEDTVPILETKREDVERKGSVTRFINSDRRVTTQSAKNLNAGNRSSKHQYAHVTVNADGEPFYQVGAQLNVWKPNVDTNGSGIASASLIWAVNGDGDGTIETVLAGWEVHPSLYGDTNPRFFVDWFIEGKHSVSGCENMRCPGFVLASGSRNYLGSPISPVSTYKGTQKKIDVQIFKEKPGGADDRWSVYLNNNLLGWWPTSMFKSLVDNAVTVGLGGQVLFYLGTPSSKTEMGSGHFPDEGLGGSALVSYIKIVNDDGVVITDFGYNKVAPRPKCYDVSDVTDGNGLGSHFFFGGPGGDDADCASPSTF